MSFIRRSSVKDHHKKKVKRRRSIGLGQTGGDLLGLAHRQYTKARRVTHYEAHELEITTQVEDNDETEDLELDMLKTSSIYPAST